jgi:DNA-binding transcriptional ArsR family regulator
MGDRRPFCCPKVRDIITFNIMNMIDDASVETQPYESQAQWLKVLTHPVRLAILNILRDGEHCVCHMEAYLGFRQSYISQQLAVLREARLIQDRRDGWNVFYRVADPKIYAVLDAVQQVLGESRATQLKARVHCPCPKCNA